MNLPLNVDYTGKVVVVTGAGGLICGAMVNLDVFTVSKLYLKRVFYKINCVLL